MWAFTAHNPVEQFVPRAYHWNGRTWRKVVLPKGLRGRITELSAVTSQDIWANVTSGDDDNGTQGFLHWNGASWRLVKKIPLSSSGSPHAFHAVARDDVWALSSGGLLHYNGRKWSVRKTRNLELFSLAIGPGGSLWAHGRNLTNDRQAVYRFDGKSWKRNTPSAFVPKLRACGVIYPCGYAGVGNVISLTGKQVMALIRIYRENNGDQRSVDLTRLA